MSAKASGDTIDKENAGSDSVYSKGDKHAESENLFERTFAPSKIFHFNAIAFIVGFAVLLGLIAFTSIQFLKSHDANTVELSGRIEAPETHISAVANTRVKNVLVNEGDAVKKGQLLIELDTGVIQAKVGNVQQYISQASRASRQADLHAAAMERQVAEARKKSSGFWTRVFTSPKGRAKEGEKLRGQMLQARMMQMQARAAVAKAQAMSSAAKEAKTNFNITSPIAGICETRSIEPGELVATGQVLLTIVDPQSVYMKGYIPEGDIGKIKLGQEADVYLDSDSKKAHKAHITSIDRAPSFTPENVYFKDDRVRQVFGVKLALVHPDGLAKPGMSAEAKINLKSKYNMIDQK
jgi:multidrug resistance efflux pump